MLIMFSINNIKAFMTNIYDDGSFNRNQITTLIYIYFVIEIGRAHV